MLELFLLAMAMKYGVMGVLFDKDRGAEIGIRAMGGQYTVFHRGEPTGMNPFQLEADEATHSFWIRLVCKLVDNGVPLSAKDELDISRAIREVARMDRSLRRLSMVRQLLPNVGDNSLHARLAKWCAGGRLGWVLDNPVDRIDLDAHRLFGFDDTERFPTQAVLRMQSRGVAPRFYRSVLDERAEKALWDAHIETLAVWRGVAQALAQSGVPEDRTMAMAIVDFVQHMPARQLEPGATRLDPATTCSHRDRPNEPRYIARFTGKQRSVNGRPPEPDPLFDRD
ncbi:hypothetical protein NUV24_24540 [Burkholderia cenocepacia]|nr:hypothetical protein [Burkholderia cenocepacia]